jgi:hypothetical protein
MSEATKNTLKDLAKVGAGLAVFVIIAFSIPDDSIVKNIFGGLIIAAFIGAILIFSPLGNPIKRLIRNFQKKKEEKSK